MCGALAGCDSSGGAGGSAGTSSPPPPGPENSASPGAASSDAAKPAAGKRPKVAYVTNGIASFWTIAQKGAEAAGRDLDCDVEVKMPTADSAVANQKRILEQLVSGGIDGVAVSPIDPDNQTEILDTVAAQTKLITHDADAPQSKRLVRALCSSEPIMEALDEAITRWDKS